MIKDDNELVYKDEDILSIPLGFLTTILYDPVQ